MSNNAGDIVATFGLDGRKWFEEASRIQQSAQGLGGQVQKGLSGVGAPGSLALNTLSSGLSQGLTGAVSTAAGGIQSTLGSKFGAVGTGIGIVAGAALAEAIVSLFNEKDAFEGIAQSVSTTNRELDAFIQRQSRISEFEKSIDSIRSTSGADSVGKSLDSQLTSAQTRFDSFSKQGKNLESEIAKLEAAKKEAGLINSPTEFGKFVNSGAEGLARRFGFSLPVDEIDAQLKSLREQRGAIREGLRSSGADIGAIKAQKDLLDQERGNIADRQSQDEADRIRSGDPFLSRQKQLEDIARLTQGGFLERSVGTAAAQRLVGEFRNSLVPKIDAGRANTANVLGSSAAFSALQETIRQDRSLQDVANDISNQQLKTLERILTAIESPAQQPEGESI